MVVGDRQRNRDLAVVLLAQLAAILPGNANRMPTLLGKARIVNDPRLERPVPFNRRQHARADNVQDGLIAPVGLGDEVMQRLMGRLNALRGDAGGHRLDTLALAGQQQPRAVGVHRFAPIGMAEHPRNRSQIPGKSTLSGVLPVQTFLCHAPNVGSPL